MTECSFCGSVDPSPIHDETVDEVFCCHECLEAYRTYDHTDSDRGDTYSEDLREHSLVGENIDRESGVKNTVQENTKIAHLSVDGMHRKTCETYIETTATETEGITDAQASYITNMVRLVYNPDFIDRRGLRTAISGLGYHATDPTEEDSGTEDRFFFNRIRTVFGTIAAKVVTVFSVVFLYPIYLGIYPESYLTGESTMLIVFVPVVFFSTVVLLFVGFPILRGAYIGVRVRQPNIDILIASAALAAYSYSVVSLFFLNRYDIYFDVSTIIVLVASMGNYLEAKYKRKALGGLSALSDSLTTEARRLEAAGEQTMVAVDQLVAGDRVLVKPGERVLVDGEIVDGRAAVDESLITGESIPQTRGVGDKVVGGSVVTDNAITIEVGEAVSSTLNRLTELLWRVQSEDSGAQRLADRTARLLIPIVITLTVATTVGWLLLGASVGRALIIGISVLVISCPSSLGLATPLAVVSGVREAVENHIVILNTTVFEHIIDTDIIALDKTGTLTTGELSVEEVFSDDPETVLARAAAVESHSNHPVAEAIAAAGGEEAQVNDFKRSPRGVTGIVDGKRVVVGHPAFAREQGLSIPENLVEMIEVAEHEGMLATVVGWDRSAHGVITTSDAPREGWADSVTKIAAKVPHVVIITGDNETMVRRFKDHTDVDEVFAGVPPDGKKTTIDRLKRQGTVTMVGDGTNDAPALASADLGIALASGTETTVQAADAVVTTDGLAPIARVFGIARGTRRRIQQNLGWALAYNLVAIPLAITGVINPLLAAAMMTVSSLVIVINSKRGLELP
jgi:Cu2+-exporting ATPase